MSTRRTWPSGTAGRALAAACAALALLAGCGVRPTDVIDVGEPAGGLTKGTRVYFVTDTGRLTGVPRPTESDHLELAGVVKLLVMGPSPEEKEQGLVTLVGRRSGYQASGSGDRVTLTVSGPEPLLAGDRLPIGQWVCSLARAQARTAKDLRSDDVRVTIRSAGERLGPYACSDFLN